MADNAMAVPLVRKLVVQVLKCLQGVRIEARPVPVTGCAPSDATGLAAQEAGPKPPTHPALHACSTMRIVQIHVPIKDAKRIHYQMRKHEGGIPDESTAWNSIRGKVQTKGKPAMLSSGILSSGIYILVTFRFPRASQGSP